MQSLPTQTPHSFFEDMLAILTGALLVSLGIALFKQEGLFTGGTAGISFLIHYSTNIPFGIIFFILNVPFYWFAWKRMGWRFTVKTFISIMLVSVLSSIHPQIMPISLFSETYAALIGGTLMGVGFIVLFRHQASLGGFNILTLYLQDKYGYRAGKLLMMMDISIVIASLTMVKPTTVLYSILGAIVLNLAIMLNHRPGRYMAV